MIPSVSGVLRIRRHQPTRLEGFIDASFAFSVTILVISFGHVPTSVPQMLHALRDLPAFAVSFLLIARIWRAHRDWSRQYDIEDATSLRLGLTLVFTVLIFVYPLRLLSGLFFFWISGGYLVDQPLQLHSVDELRNAYEVYGIGYGTIAGLIALHYRHALRCAAGIGLDPRELLATRMHFDIWTSLAAIAVLSILCAALLPFDARRAWTLVVPGAIYALAGFAAGYLTRRCLRRMQALPAP